MIWYHIAVTFGDILDVVADAERGPRDAGEAGQDVPLHVQQVALHEVRLRRAERAHARVVFADHYG